MMNPKDLKKLLAQVERLVLTQPRTGGDTKFQMSILFHDAVECIEYRIPKHPILLNKNGHEFKCPTCGTVFDSPESHVSEYDLCYVCGQLWKDHGTTMEELYGVRESKNEYKPEYKNEYKPAYGRKKRGKKR